MSLDYNEAVEFLDNVWDLRSEIVPCLIGSVGIGKTSAVHEHAKNVGAGKVVTFIASQILPSEVSGITMPVLETKSLEIFDHYKLSSLKDGDILFFDELFEADQCVLSACLTLIESRLMMSGKKLPDIQIIAATNPTIAPSQLKESIRQRFMFMPIKANRHVMANYIHAKTGIHPDLELCDEVIRDDLGGKNANKYNFLSPRTLTKLYDWISTVGKSALIYISTIFGSNVALIIEDDYDKYLKSSLLVRAKEVALPYCADWDGFKNCTPNQLYNYLKSLPEWNEVKDLLAAEKVED